ncbi:ABC transporter ATP-binding protein [Anaerosinus massiliensis]|uniref:ABC transporter ATP-binding protein n=1 Tax=Massilibacillus massiliensis TaxID=1806837 RepID=UPI000DA62273|nr:ABC transporter ATP-binding protein [Massilibacillus massiliensis]
MNKQQKSKPPNANTPIENLQGSKEWKKVLHFLWLYLAPKKILLITAFLLVLVNIATTLGGTAYLEPLIDQFLQPQNVDTSIEERFIGLAHGTVMLAGIYLLSVLAAYGQNKIMLHIAQKTIYEIRMRLFQHVQTLSIRYHDTHTTGEMMSRFSNDVDTLNDALQNSMLMFFSSVITIISIFFMMISRSSILTLIAFLVIPLTLFCVNRLTKISGKYFTLQQKNLGTLNGYVEEIMSGQKVVKVFGYEDKVKKDFMGFNTALCETAMAAQSYAGMMMPLARNLNNVIYAGIVMIGGMLVVFGQMSLGALVVFLQFTLMFGRPINEASNQYNTVVTALAGTKRIVEILEEKVEAVTDENHEFVLKRDTTGGLVWRRAHDNACIPVCGNVVFDDVSFGYSKEKEILTNISLQAKVGQKVAFVGATGAGKTTILNLITRFYEVDRGMITIDGIDIRDIEKSSLRRAIAVVLQDTHLFTGTIRENIRYGRQSADDSEVESAAKLVNAHSFIKKLAKGYDTMIEGDGANLSQGQRQLLNIARAALSKAPMLILDEATSSVDTRTEMYIEQGLKQLMQQCTTFIVAHRLSTVRNADLIFVMEQGKIIEKGNHQDLLQFRGHYYNMYTGTVELD